MINPRTKDNKSSLDSVTLSLYHKLIGKNNTRSNKIRKYSDTIIWKHINFPPTERDYKQLERNNENIKLSVLEINDNGNVYYVCKSKFDDRKNEANLFLLEKKHYVYIKNLLGVLYYSSESKSESKS